MKILAVFTGGTISCSESGGVLSPNKGNSFLLLKSRPDVCFDALMPYTILSENLGAEELELLYKTVSDNISKGYDGIIVAHGTDTVQYSATYLALRLGLCAVPVVLVSANYPLSDSRSNGYDNFSAAVDFIAAKQGRGVFVSYRNSGGFKVLPVSLLYKAVNILRYKNNCHSLLRFGNCQLCAVKSLIFLCYFIKVNSKSVSKLTDSNTYSACSEIVAALYHC